MASRIVLITGCSTGVGLWAAVVLAKQPGAKFKVYATMRNMSKKSELEKEAGSCLNKTLFIRKLDVKDEKTFKPVLDEIISSEGQLDVLINNAAVGMVTISEVAPLEGIRHVIDTNLVGLFRLIQAIIPIMKKQKSGHVINVTSLGGIEGTPYTAIYSASKFGVEGLTECLAAELMADNIRFSIVEPGMVHTNFMENLQSTSGTGMDNPDIDEDTKKRFTMYFNKMATGFSQFAQTSEEVGKVFLKVLTDENPSLRYQTSDFIMTMAKSKLVDSTGNNHLARIREMMK